MEKVSEELDLSAIGNKCIAGSSRGWFFVADNATQETALINPLTGAEVHLPRFCSFTLCYYCKKVVISSDPIADTDNCVVMVTSTQYILMQGWR
jgi:hypothetical protein